MKRKLKSSCLKQKEQLSLPSQMGIGCVAQLNRASDYGSEGLRFESLRGHLKNHRKFGGFFML